MMGGDCPGSVRRCIPGRRASGRSASSDGVGGDARGDGHRGGAACSRREVPEILALIDEMPGLTAEQREVLERAMS